MISSALAFRISLGSSCTTSIETSAATAGAPLVLDTGLSPPGPGAGGSFGGCAVSIAVGGMIGDGGILVLSLPSTSGPGTAPMLVASVLKASTALAATFAVLFHPSWHQIVGNPVALSSVRFSER